MNRTPGLSGNYTSISSRIAVTVVFVAAILLLAHYNSWLYAMLTVHAPPQQFDSFMSILDDGTYIIGIVDGWSTKTEIEVMI